MCIITNENDIVVAVSFIPGDTLIPSTYHCYFPANCTIQNLPKEGDHYKE